MTEISDGRVLRYLVFRDLFSIVVSARPIESTGPFSDLTPISLQAKIDSSKCFQRILAAI